MRIFSILFDKGSGVKKLRNKNKGFTLIELLVVIAIIGLLASVVLLALNSARQKSRDAKRLADVRQLASALELFYNDASAYPTCASCATGGTMSSVGTLRGGIGNITLTPTYIGLIPSAPLPADGSPSCGAANDYKYAAPVAGDSYTLTFCIGAATGGYGPGTHTLTPAGIQ